MAFGAGAAGAEEVSPKFENRTLPSERFMALAMSCVSNGRADHGAGDDGGVVEHEAFEPTASPVSALYEKSPRHVGARWQGQVTPSSSANAKNRNAGRLAGLGRINHEAESGDQQDRQIHEFLPPKRTDRDQALEFRERYQTPR